MKTVRQTISNQQSSVESSADRFFSLLGRHSMETLPFLFIILLKLIGEHSTGIFAFLFVSTSIFHGNRLSKADKTFDSTELVSSLLFLLVLVGSSIVFVLLPANGELWRLLTFQKVDVASSSLADLFWILCSAFATVKLFVLLTKLSIVLLCQFNSSISFYLNIRRRSKIFASIEIVSNFYLRLIPIHPWLRFLIRQGTWSNIVLLLLYLSFKIFNLYSSVKTSFSSIKQILDDRSFVRSSRQSTDEEQNCPICQSTANEPCLLVCQHVFCERCLFVWLDQQSTCPVCRLDLFKEKDVRRQSATSNYFLCF